MVFALVGTGYHDHGKTKQVRKFAFPGIFIKNVLPFENDGARTLEICPGC